MPFITELHSFVTKAIDDRLNRWTFPSTGLSARDMLRLNGIMPCGNPEG
jgi:hypothetical protein